MPEVAECIHRALASRLSFPPPLLPLHPPSSADLCNFHRSMLCYYIHHGSQRRNSRSQDGVYPEPYMVPLPFDRDAFIVPVSDAIRGAKDVLKQHGSQGSGNRFRSSSPAWSANRDCLSACTRPAKQPIRPPAPAARFPAFDSDNNSKTKLLCIGASSLLAAVKSTDESG